MYETFFGISISIQICPRLGFKLDIYWQITAKQEKKIFVCPYSNTKFWLSFVVISFGPSMHLAWFSWNFVIPLGVMYQRRNKLHIKKQKKKLNSLVLITNTSYDNWNLDKSPLPAEGGQWSFFLINLATQCTFKMSFIRLFRCQEVFINHCTWHIQCSGVRNMIKIPYHYIQILVITLAELNSDIILFYIVSPNI